MAAAASPAHKQPYGNNHVEDRERYFRRLAASLKPGGRLAVIDFKLDEAERHQPGRCAAPGHKGALGSEEHPRVVEITHAAAVCSTARRRDMMTGCKPTSSPPPR